MHMSCVFPINANQTVIVNGFLPRSLIFHSFTCRDITIGGRGLNNKGIWLLMEINEDGKYPN